MGQLEKIDHVVVLMLENRSFDSLLGTLYPKSESFEGLSGDEFNLNAAGARLPVWNASGIDEVTMRIPDPDPGELWEDINTQLLNSCDRRIDEQLRDRVTDLRRLWRAYSAGRDMEALNSPGHPFG